MKRTSTLLMAGSLLVSATLGSIALAESTQDKNALKVPGGLAFSQFKGYESWHGGIGHNLPKEAPQAFTQDLIDADHF